MYTYIVPVLRKYRPTSVHLQECPVSAFADEFPLGFFSEWGIWTLVGGWTPLAGYFLYIIIAALIPGTENSASSTRSKSSRVWRAPAAACSQWRDDRPCGSATVGQAHPCTTHTLGGVASASSSPQWRASLQQERQQQQRQQQWRRRRRQQQQQQHCGNVRCTQKAGDRGPWAASDPRRRSVALTAAMGSRGQRGALTFTAGRLCAALGGGQGAPCERVRHVEAVEDAFTT